MRWKFDDPTQRRLEPTRKDKFARTKLLRICWQPAAEDHAADNDYLHDGVLGEMGKGAMQID